MARAHGLRPFDRAAVARVIEHASRACGNAERLSVEMGPLLEVLAEASYWAGERGTRRRRRRTTCRRRWMPGCSASNRLPVRIREEMLRGRLLVATEGERVGQVNGLSVAELGGVLFGIPVRITARVHAGGGNVVDIEREAQLGGRLHCERRADPLRLPGRALRVQPAADAVRLARVRADVRHRRGRQRVVGGALRAAVGARGRSGLQRDRVTGSVNQHGDVQAIGAVNEKIEGYFDLCALRGLTGAQGVIIPAANVAQLMLRHDVVDAVAEGKFSIYAVSTVDEGLEVLTRACLPARAMRWAVSGGSLNARIEERLLAYAERMRSFAAPHPPRTRRRGPQR